MRKEYKQEHRHCALACGRNAGRINQQPKTLVISGRHVGRGVMQKGQPIIFLVSQLAAKLLEVGFRP